MRNYEVAKCLVTNAIAYLQNADIRTVFTNLDKINMLLENPIEENTEYDWEDFK